MCSRSASLMMMTELEGPHIVQPVRQLDDDDPDILGHGQEHFPQVLRLHFQFVGRIGQPSQFGDAVHQKRYLFPEHFPDLVLAHLGVLHHIVEESRRDGLLIHLQVRQDNGHPQRMDDVRLPGFAALVAVGLLRRLIGLPDHAHVRGRMVLTDTGN